MVRIAARDTDHAIIRVLDYTIISAMSTSTKVTSNLILVVLRCHIVILLTLEALHNAAFLRVDIKIMILVIQKNIILYDEISLS